jgi:hypothetical protein
MGPAYYSRWAGIYVKFALSMSVLGLLMGIAYQESTKKAPISDVLPLGAHLEATYHLSLVHGHSLLMGCILPLTVLWLLYLGTRMNRPALSENLLSIGSKLYLAGTAVATILMIYKGYHLLLGVRGEDFLAGKQTFEAIQHSFFGGEEAIRKTVYALSHIALSGGFFTLVFGFWKSWSGPALSSESAQ